MCRFGAVEDLIMFRKTILGTLAAGTVTGVVMFVLQIVRQFAVADWVSTGEPTTPAVVATLAVVLIAVAGGDFVRVLVRAAARS
jgi:hypothetical protein